MRVLDLGPKVVTRVGPDFDQRPYERFALTPLSPSIGAEVGGVALGGPIDDELQAELRRALLEWKVLFFRDQDITRDQQRDFALRWGPLERHPFYSFIHADEDDDVVRLAKDQMSGGAENEWHADVTWHTEPSWGAVLRAVEVPELGGDTLWADAAAAHDALPADLRERIADLTAVHDWQHTFGLAMTDEVRETLAERHPPSVHPVVRIHPETGRRTLFVNRIFTRRIVGLPEAEGDALLDRLTHQLTRPEHQCRFRWTPGAVAFWDNRATQHYASSDYWPARRVMDRISVAGDRPFGPSAAG